MFIINIEPQKQIFLDADKPKIASVEVECITLEPTVKAIFDCRVKLSDGTLHLNTSVTLEGADYQGWNDDAPYLQTKILGLLVL